MKRLTACCMIGAAVLAGGAPGAESPATPVRWGGGFSPNQVSSATNLPADPGHVSPLWEIKLGTHQYSIPTVDRGRIYLGINDAGVVQPGYTPAGGGAVVCLDQATGRMLWQYASPRFMQGVKPPYHFDQFRCGVCSGPVVDGDRVFVVGNRGEILCLARDGRPGTTEGAVVWRHDLLKDLGVVPHDVCGSTLLMIDDLLVACTSNGIDARHARVPAPLAPSLIVLDKRTGRLLAVDGGEIGRRLMHGSWSSPSAGRVNGRMLIFFGGGDGILYAFDPPSVSASTGGVQRLRQVWSHDCNPPDYRERAGRPIPYSRWDGKSPDGPSEIIGVPVFHQDRVYVAIGQSPLHGTGHGCLSCVDAETGAKVWETRLVDRSLATVAIADGLLYIPDVAGNLHCFDAVTGARSWVHPMGSGAWASSAFVADGKVYAGTEAGVLWTLKAGRTLQVLSRTHLPAVPATPAAVDGVLYLPTQRGLSALPGTPER